MRVKKIKKIGIIVLSFLFKPATTFTVIFFLLVHLLGSLEMYFNQGDFISLINEVSIKIDLSSSVTSILIKLFQIKFGTELLLVIIEAVLLIVFISMAFYEISKSSRLKKDSKNIDEIKELSAESNVGINEANKQIAEIKQLLTEDSKSKIDVVKLETNLIEISKYCINLSRSGKPNKALEILEQNKGLLEIINNNSIARLEFDIAEARALRESSRIDEAIDKNEQIASSYKTEIRPYLYLADIYLQVSDFEKYNEYIAGAEKIDSKHPTLRNLDFVKRIKSGENNLVLDDDDIWGDTNSLERAHCYYIHSVASNVNGDNKKRDEFLDLAIKINPESLSYQSQKIDFAIYDLNIRKKNGENIFSSNNITQIKQDIEKLEFIIKDDDAQGRILEVERLNLELSFLQHPHNEYHIIKKTVERITELLIQTRFDDFNDMVMVSLLDGATPFITKDMLNKLVGYVSTSNKKPSELLIFLFASSAIACYENIDEAILLLSEYSDKDTTELLASIKSKNEKDVLTVIDRFDENKKLKIILSINDIPLRLKLIEGSIKTFNPGNKDILLKLKASILMESQDFDSVIELMKNIDLKNADAIISEMAFNAARELGMHLHIERDALKRLLELNTYPERKYEFITNLAFSQYYLKEFPEALKNAKDSLENRASLSVKGIQSLLFLSLDILIAEGKIDEAESLLIRYNDIKKDYRISMKMSEILLAKKKYDEAVKAVVVATQEVENISSEQLLASSSQLIMIENASGIERIESEKVVVNTFVKLSGLDEWFYIGNKDKSMGAINFESDKDQRYKILINKNKEDKIKWPGDDGRIDKIERRIDDIRCAEDYIGIRGAQEMQRMAQAGSPFIKMIEVGTTPESIESSLLNFFEKENDIFKQFIENKLPFSFYASLIGSIGNSFSKIRMNMAGFVNTVLNFDDWLRQNKLAEEALNGKKVYIDGTSIFMLVESGCYKKILSKLPNFGIPSSAIEEYRTLIGKFSSIPKDGSLQIGIEKNKIRAVQYDEVNANKIKDNIKEFCDYAQEKANLVFGIDKQERSSNLIEEKILPSLSDAVIKSQQDVGSIVMTEDPLYLELNSKFTKKLKPDSFSLLSFAETLFKNEDISLDDYLNIFYWLTVYRLKFFPTNATLIVDSVVRNIGNLVAVYPDSIDKLNLSLIWSDEYGAEIKSVINVGSDVLVSLIQNISISEQYLKLIYQKIYVPILNGRDKNYWGQLLLKIVAIKINKLIPGFGPEIEQRFILLQQEINEFLKKA